MNAGVEAVDFLAGMAASSRDRTEAARARLPISELRARLRDLPPAPRLRLSPQGFDLIAEMKLRSPAIGALRDARDEDVTQRVLAYADAGAAAVSVLTEPSRFDGTSSIWRRLPPRLRHTASRRCARTSSSIRIRCWKHALLVQAECY